MKFENEFKKMISVESDKLDSIFHGIQDFSNFLNPLFEHAINKCKRV